MAHTNVQLVSGNLTTGGEDPTFYVDRVNNMVGIGGVPDTSGDDSTNVLQVNGSMLATKYHGDGSSLTGLNDSKWLEYSGDASKIYYNGGNVGIGTNNPDGTLHVQADNRVHITAGTVPAFTGVNAVSDGRSQLVLSSRYSDLVIASSYVNNNHGSTLSFAAVNPSNTAEYRKFVINQGNWGSRKDFLDFGLSASASDPNPHSSINSTDTVLTLDGNNKRVGIGTISPGYKLHVYDGTAQASWRNFYVRPTSLWGDGLTTASETAGTKYMTMNMIMLQGPHITPSSTGQNAYIRYGRAGGIASGNWWETACVTDGSFRIRREANDSYGMTINSSGYVGIGTSSPGAKLHVNGDANINLGSGSRQWFAWDSPDAGTRYSSTGTWSYASIYASWHIVTKGSLASAGGVVGASDERIKKDIIDVDDGSALETLRLLKPKQYKYKDYARRGSEPVWGFIAQEVRETLPYATIIKSDSIPNIYELVTVSNSNVITFTNFDTSTLVSNASVLNIFDMKEVEHTITINEVIDEHTIRVEEDLSEWIASIDETGNVVAGNQLFVYGQEVDDFIYLKKEAIFTVATAALQEVDRQLQAEKARNDALEARITALENA